MAAPLPVERPRPPLRVVRGGRRERVSEEEDLSLSHPPPQHHRAPRELLLSERALARWLRRRLGTVGAEAMVRKHGAGAVLDALYDGVVVVRETTVRVGYPGELQVRRWYEVSKALRNPGGFLRFVLDQGVGR